MTREIGTIWRVSSRKDDRWWKIQMPRGIHATKTLREAKLFAESAMNRAHDEECALLGMNEAEAFASLVSRATRREWVRSEHRLSASVVRVVYEPRSHHAHCGLEVQHGQCA